MKDVCPDALLADFDESSATFEKYVEHLNGCKRCRLRADESFAQDDSALEFSRLLRDTTQDDLVLEEYQSTISLRFSLHDDSRLEIEGEEFQAGTPNLDFLPPPSHPELLGRLGRYDVERVIGAGGMGIVFRAYDTELHRIVALKVLTQHLASNGAARKRFSREAQAAAAVLHPNVLPIFNVEATGETPYLVMQFVSGQSLQTRVQRDGPLPMADVLRISKQTAEALAAAHAQGLIHRDVKPANILLEDETDRVVLGDFGLARTADDASLTRTGIVSGTPHYMSPEQASGEAITAHSDLFSLGSVMYFMLTGHPPFRAESAMSVLNCVCTKKHAPLQSVNHEVPRELAHVVDRLLSKKATQRFPDAQAVARRCEQLLSKLQSGHLRITSSPSGKWIRPLVMPLALATAGVLSFAVFLNVFDMDKPNATTRSDAFVSEPAFAQAGPPDTSIAKPSQPWSDSEYVRDDWQPWDAQAQVLRSMIHRYDATQSSQWNLSSLLNVPDRWSSEQQKLNELLDQVELSEQRLGFPQIRVEKEKE